MRAAVQRPGRRGAGAGGRCPPGGDRRPRASGAFIQGCVEQPRRPSDPRTGPRCVGLSPWGSHCTRAHVGGKVPPLRLSDPEAAQGPGVFLGSPSPRVRDGATSPSPPGGRRQGTWAGFPPPWPETPRSARTQLEVLLGFGLESGEGPSGVGEMRLAHQWPTCPGVAECRV